MKFCTRNQFLLRALIAGIGCVLVSQMAAQTLVPLYSFTGLSDGASPSAGLILSDNTLYGTAYSGGSSANGTVFKLNTDGTGFTNLYSFSAGNYNSATGVFTNSDGANPSDRLILSGNILYGTTRYGGNSGNGTLFAVKTNGTGFTTLHSFTAMSAPFNTNSDGAHPQAGLILSGNILFGTAYDGGSSAKGTVFKLNTDGTGFMSLYAFDGPDGANPVARLILSGNILLGTTLRGGSSVNGTVFKLNTDGTSFTNLHSFAGYPNDGAAPYGGLLLSGNSLFGTANQGGSSDSGIIFEVNIDGTGFTTLHNFGAVGFPDYSNSDGAYPVADLLLSSNTLYATAAGGGSSANGTIFKVNTDGTGFSTLYNFTASHTNSLGNYTNSDGANPNGGLIVSGSSLLGTANQGGGSGFGTIFSLSLESINLPQLTITPLADKVILTWPASTTGFTLQSTTNVISSSVWTAVSPGPIIVNGQNTVTNTLSGTHRFYRLSQ